MKVRNLFVPMKKGSVSQSTKKVDDSSETCLYIVLFEGGLPLIGSIVLESSPPPFTPTYSSRHPVTGKSRPATLRPSTDAPSSSKTRGSKRKTSPPLSSATSERRVCYL